jgi:hypothetical protein
MEQLKEFAAILEAAAKKLKLPGYLKDLPAELIEDVQEALAETAKLLNSNLIGSDQDLTKIFKSKVRTKWYATYNDAWKRADWWVQAFVRPFIEPYIIKGFREVWSRI